MGGGYCQWCSVDINITVCCTSANLRRLWTTLQLCIKHICISHYVLSLGGSLEVSADSQWDSWCSMYSKLQLSRALYLYLESFINILQDSHLSGFSEESEKGQLKSQEDDSFLSSLFSQVVHNVLTVLASRFFFKKEIFKVFIIVIYICY